MTLIFNKTSEKTKRKKLRQPMPLAEATLWKFIRNKQLGYKFRRQYSIKQYVVDFYCPSIKLAIEVDGDSHFDKQAKLKDAKRQKILEKTGVKFLRFSNHQIYKNLDYVLETIKEFLP